MVRFDQETLETLDRLLEQITRLEVKFRVTILGSAPEAFYEHLHTLGKLGVAYIGRYVLEKTHSRLLATGWAYQITGSEIIWYHTAGLQKYHPSKTVSINDLIHFFDKGTAAHGPVVAEFLVFEIDGKFIRTKRVRGIRAKYLMAGLRKYVKQMHEYLFPDVLRKLYEDV